VDTTAFLDYLAEHRASAALAGSLRDLIAHARERAQRRALARQRALLPIPLPIDPRSRRSVAS
jgi:hypothetical protein